MSELTPPNEMFVVLNDFNDIVGTKKSEKKADALARRNEYYEWYSQRYILPLADRVTDEQLDELIQDFAHDERKYGRDAMRDFIRQWLKEMEK